MIIKIKFKIIIYNLHDNLLESFKHIRFIKYDDVDILNPYIYYNTIINPIHYQFNNPAKIKKYIDDIEGSDIFEEEYEIHRSVMSIYSYGYYSYLKFIEQASNDKDTKKTFTKNQKILEKLKDNLFTVNSDFIWARRNTFNNFDFIVNSVRVMFNDNIIDYKSGNIILNRFDLF